MASAAPPVFAYKIVAILTTFIAAVSLLVAGVLALRLDRTRGALQGKLAACPCCQEALAPPPAAAP